MADVNSQVVPNITNEGRFIGIKPQDLVTEKIFERHFVYSFLKIFGEGWLLNLRPPS